MPICREAEKCRLAFCVRKKRKSFGEDKVTWDDVYESSSSVSDKSRHSIKVSSLLCG